MKHSENYNLNLPEKADQFNIDHWNENTNIIDSELKEASNNRQSLLEKINQEINDRQAGDIEAKNLENATGVLAVGKGGTGANTGVRACNSLLQSLETDASTPIDTDTFISQYAGGSGSNETSPDKNNFYRRPVSALWEYIKGKISSVLGLTSTSYGGNSATATKATQDSAGQQINTTYIKALSISGKTITYTKGNGTTGTLTTQDTVYTHPTTSGNKHIPSGGSSGQILRWSSDGTAVWGADNNTTYSVATTSANGLMSASDKTKLNGIASGANAYSLPTASSSTLGGVKVKKTTSVEGSSSSQSITITSSNMNKIIEVSTSSGKYVDVYNNSGVPLKVFITGYDSSTNYYVESAGIVPNGKSLKSDAMQSANKSCYVYTETLNVIL